MTDEKDVLTVVSGDVFTVSLGIPAITMGAGGEAGQAHTTDEWYRNVQGPDGILRALLTLVLAAGYYAWGPWRSSRMLPTTTPATDEPDTGFGQPMIEEAEALAEAASRSSPSGPNRPGS